MTQPDKAPAFTTREWSWIKEQIDRVAKAEAQEILAGFDEMVTLTPRESERSDIITFRHWLRGRIG